MKKKIVQIGLIHLADFNVCFWLLNWVGDANSDDSSKYANGSFSEQ